MIALVKQDIKNNIKGKLLYNELMSRHTSFRIGGPAEVLVEPEDIDDLKNCVQLSRDRGIPLSIIGSGSNLLVNDKGMKGIVINMLSPSLKNIYLNNCNVIASSSVTLGEFLSFCCNNGLGGMEFLAGIPGSIGGAVMTNAGARHYEKTEKWDNIGDFVEEIKIMKYDGEIEVLDKGAVTFGYKSLNLIDCIILEVKFLLTKSSSSDVLSECQRFLKRKKETQELNMPSAGCIFKNPPGIARSAGELIDECGLKGMKIGGAEFSKKHANFIINTGKASSSDVMALIDIAKEKVKNRFGIELTLEIKIV